MQSDINISPDEIVYFTWRFVEVNANLVFTWVIIPLLSLVSYLVTRKMSTSQAIPRMQNLLEIIVSITRKQVHDITRQETDEYLPFLGSLFLFILFSNVLNVIPGMESPTGSIYTTAALAICVFFAVPYFGIRKKGVRGYLKRYITPTFLMLPFNIISDLSRTLSLAVRLFGNIMSGTLIVAILISLVPLFFPLALQILGLIIGVIQAYIFTVLAAVYIGSATRQQLGEES
ncbi:MAG: F0F1 ATP synthase subunit A [Spirochaeta sp.]